MTDRCTTTVTSTQVCVDCAEQPRIAYIPAHIAVTPIIGWNAGANSVVAKRYRGDVHGVWNSPLGTSGTVVGLAPAPRSDVTDVASITHGIYVYTISGVSFAQAVTSGQPQGTPQQLFEDVQLEVIRAAGVIQCFVHTSTEAILLFEAPAPYDDLTLLACTMYASGDVIK